MVWFDLIDVLLYDVRVNARECSIRAARDQITQTREGFIRSLLLVFFKRVVFAVLAVSVIFPALMKRVHLHAHLKRYFWSSVALVCFYKHKTNIVLYILL